MEWNLFSFSPARDPKQLNPLALAFIGDAIYEVFVRQYLLSLNNHRPYHLHKQATLYVSAKAQANSLIKWLPMLTDEELEVVKKGRNAKSGGVPKNTEMLTYRHSTGFECLIGYLYFQQKFERLNTLMNVTVPGGE